MALEYNGDRVRKITSEMLTALQRLEELRRLPESEFSADPHRVASSKYNLLVAIEGAVDLCHHVIAKNCLRTPEDYADTFRVMQERGALDKEFSDTMIRMTRFRNRLVHIYWDIAEGELYRILQTHLDDIRLFLKRFGEFIGRT